MRRNSSVNSSPYSHGSVGDLRVAAPVERVALAAGPGAAGVDGAVAGYLSGNVGDRLVVAQGVEVVFEEAAPPRVVYPGEGSSLAEVRGEDADAHLQQLRQLLLVPAHSVRVAEVYDRVVNGWFAVGAQDDVALLDGLGVQLVVRVEVGELPQAYAEAVVFQVGDHAPRVGEAGGGELEVAAVGHFRPARVEVDDVGGDPVLAQLLRDVPDFVFG